MNASFLSNGVVLSVVTGAVVKHIDPASDITFACDGQSFMKTTGEIVSLVVTEDDDIRMICYNLADDRITTIHNYGGEYQY